MDLNYLMHSCMILKDIPRTGWLQRGIPPSEVESVAEHTYEVVSILAAIGMAAGKGLDTGRMLLMGTIHDWGEAVSGDMPLSLTVRLGREAKMNVDHSIMRELSEKSGMVSLIQIFKDYEKRDSQESILVKIADLLSTMRQAEAYSERGFKVEDIVEGCSGEIAGLIDRIDSDGVRSLIKMLL